MKNNLHKEGFDFLTIGDKKYFDIISLSVNQINKIYPNAKTFIYDWGFDNKQKEILKNKKNVILLSWNKLFLDVNVTFTSLLQKLKIVYGIRINNIRTFLSFLKKKKYSKDQYSEFIKRQILFANKVFVFLDHAKKNKQNFVFLDGDACVINRFDELLADNFDIGVTLRRKSEINLKFGECVALNSGVIFFFGSANKNEKFIKLWLKKTLSIKEPWVEQTALSRMLLEVDPYIFNDYYKVVALNSNNERINVKVLPCEIYNYNWIEEGFNPKIQKILHFKSGRHIRKIFDETIAKIDE